MEELASFFATRGLSLGKGIGELRDTQLAALEWGRRSTKPYLLINAPTGSGKTLLLGALGCTLGQSWTYATNTIRLQEQVTDTFPGLPVATGRANHPCLIGAETHKRDVTAAEGICTALEWCEYSGWPATKDWQLDKLAATGGRLCDYYETRNRALASHWRTANYAYVLADYHTFIESGKTEVMLCDEAHSIDDAVARAGELVLSLPMYRRCGLPIPNTTNVARLVAWAKSRLWSVQPSVARRTAPDMAQVTIRQQLESVRAIVRPDDWIVEKDKYTITLRPIWGRSLTPRILLGAESINAPRRGVFASATLVGAEYYAHRLGLPEGSWDYLELSHTFAPEKRPINFAPVMAMNAATTEDPVARARMQTAIDQLIEWYMMRGSRAGLVHAVSNRYRDYMLTESRYRGMMVSDPDEHALRVRNKEASVLVAANLLEGWDGVGDLCRFTILPKVPFGYLGDRRTALQKEADPQSYDYQALIAVIQGAGRGVRTEEDYCDTWILDTNWESLQRRRKSWLPQWFMDAYKHRVKLPD